MLELLISELLNGQKDGFRDGQSLLRLLGPLGNAVSPASGLGASAGISSEGGAASSLLRMAGGVGGVLGLPGLVQSLLGGSRRTAVAAPPLRLMRYAAPVAYGEEYAFASRQGVQAVARQDEFGRSEARKQQALAPEVSLSAATTPVMDGRMFLQYSDEIAQAVRQALLYSHPLNEWISE